MDLKRFIDCLLKCLKESDVSEPEPVKPKLELPKGVADISTFRRIPDFKNFDEKFLITRATWSMTRDATLNYLIENCEKLGIKLGYYHFYSTSIDPIAQADYFIDTVGLDRLKKSWCGPIVDNETSTAAKQDDQDLRNDLDDLYRCCEHIYKRVGVKPRIYTGEWLLNWLPWPKKFLDVTSMPWIANYKERPVRFSIWPKIWGWQKTSKHITKGIVDGKGKVVGNDYSEIYGD